MALIDFLRSGVAFRRAPDQTIGGTEDPYLQRWYVLPRNPMFNVYLHLFLRSDDDRALHSHPWLFNFSWLLDGRYFEHLPGGGGVLREAGAKKFRWGSAFHRIELIDGACWTLFMTGPRIRSWGFMCPQGFVHWKKFTAPHDSGVTGRGCE